MIHLSCLFLHIWVRNCVMFFFLFFSIFTHEKAMGYVNRSHKFSCFCKEDEYCQGNISRGVERGELILVKLFIFQWIYSKQWLLCGVFPIFYVFSNFCLIKEKPAIMNTGREAKNHKTFTWRWGFS